MKNKIHASDISIADRFWYIYQGGGKCQLIQLLVEDISGAFSVQMEDNSGECFDLFPLRIDHDENGFYTDLFKYDDRKTAEILWCHYFIKDFKENTFMEYNKFISLTAELHQDYPELLLKGL